MVQGIVVNGPQSGVSEVQVPQRAGVGKGVFVKGQQVRVVGNVQPHQVAEHREAERGDGGEVVGAEVKVDEFEDPDEGIIHQLSNPVVLTVQVNKVTEESQLQSW